MAEQHDPQDAPEDAASLVPNRRERRGNRSSAEVQQGGVQHGGVQHGGKSAVTRRSGPAALPRQYSTRRRSG